MGEMAAAQKLFWAHTEEGALRASSSGGEPDHELFVDVGEQAVHVVGKEARIPTR